jgi:hypothetical protein
MQSCNTYTLESMYMTIATIDAPERAAGQNDKAGHSGPASLSASEGVLREVLLRLDQLVCTIDPELGVLFEPVSPSSRAAKTDEQLGQA